jgi:pimeloyl-ACP methyl ester carboxylesterase
MTTIPTTKYARSGDVHVAYQVVGEGSRNLVLVPGWVSHLEYAWEEPYYSGFSRRLASFARLILLDRRGTGLSDRVSDLPTLEQVILRHIAEHIAEKGTPRERAPPPSALASRLHQSSGLLQVR